MQHSLKGKPNHSKLRNKCSSGKIRYRDKVESINVLHAKLSRREIEIESTGRSSRNEKRAYKCVDCLGWHLSSIAEWRTSPSTTPIHQKKAA